MDYKTLFRFPEGIEGEDYITATYYLETPLDLHRAADALAAEQSTGTWRRVGYETDEVRKKHACRVIGVYPIPREVTGAALPTGVDLADFFPDTQEAPTRFNSGILRIAFPHINFGPRLANLLSAVAGNLYEMGAFTAIKLLDLEFPQSYLDGFQGPKLGIKGTREILGVYDRPLIGAIIKPCVGLSPESLAELAYQGARGGLDFIKDDELIANPEYNPLEERVKRVMEALDKAERETGEKTMYAFNITDRADEVLRLHDIVYENGGNAVMLNFVTAGFPVLRMLAEHTKLPIHCHRDFFPSITRSPYVGMTTEVFTKLSRLAGADQLHCGAIQGKLYESDDEVLINVRTCIQDFSNIGASLPVISGGQWAGKVPVNLRKIGHNDFILLSGAGVYAHPDGAEAGARSVRQALDATLQGIRLEEYAKDHDELRRAIEGFGKVKY
ncbi:MAG TPA: ribulose 1,5-bisphosphate carboxylase [Candidatus Latescibacteria bacterium]|nr:ribulose 1,5-bisphosphate carboxylase [Candidatus Latescibacterota bacterium]